MKFWRTVIKAICPNTGEITTWAGEHVQAPTWELAQKWCDKNKGYLRVIGQLRAEIPCDEETYEADFGGKIDYELIGNN